MSSCEIPQAGRKKYGYADNFMNPLKRFVGDNPSNNVVRNIARRVGLDDPRALDLEGANGKKIFGKNLKDIEEYNVGKDQIPKDTIVKVTTEDGSLVHFKANKKTQLPPSRWLVDGTKVDINPDWDQLSKNVTITPDGSLQPYRQKGKGKLYIKTTADDPNAVFLNIQKLAPRSNKDGNYKLAEQGYDARMTEKGLKVFHNKQVVDPESLAIVPDEIKAIKPEKAVAETASTEEVANELETIGLGKRVAYGVAGNVAGRIVDQDEDDVDGATIGTILGVLAGSRRVRASVMGTFKKSADGADEYDTLQKSLAKNEEETAELRELRDAGFAGKLTDKTEIEKYKNEVKNTVDKLKTFGGNIKSFLVNNDYFEGGISFLSKLSPLARKLGQTLRGVETASIPYFEMFSRNIEKRFGREVTPEKFGEIQVETMRRLFPQETTGKGDDAVREIFGERIHRIITQETKLVDGELTYRDSDAARRAYDDPDVAETDRILLSDPEVQRIVDTVKDTFDEYRDRVEKAYMTQIDTVIDLVDPDYRSLLIKFQQAGIDSREFKKSLRGDEATLFRKGFKENEGFAEVVEMTNRIHAMRSLGGRYVPQIYSFTKADEMKRRFIKQEGLQNKTPKEQSLAWERYQTNMILRINSDGTLVEATDNMMDYTTKTFRRSSQAVNELRNHVALKIEDPEIRDELLNDLRTDNVSQYIGSKMLGDGQEVYFIKNPDKMSERGVNIMEMVNGDEVGMVRKMHLNNMIMKRSHFLDNPRHYILPTEMLETDIQKIVEIYSKDVGTRVHLIEKGLGSKFQLEDMMEKIGKEVDKRTTDRNEVTRQMNRVRSWYNHMVGINDSFDVGKTADQIIDGFEMERRNNKLLDSLRNFGYMPFLWFTTVYAPWQPFILGGFMARFGNIGKTYAHYFKNPEDLKIVTDELFKMGVMTRKISSFAPEMDEYWSTDALRGGKGDIIDSLYHISRKGVDFSATFSPMKSLLQKAGVDIEKSGLLRLAVGDMLDVSGAESALMTMAVFRQIEEYIDVFKRMGDEGVDSLTHKGHRYNRADIVRQMNEFGVVDVDRFMETSNLYNNAHKKSNWQSYMGRFKNEDIDMENIPQYYREELSIVADNIVNQYHGRTRMSRPLTWTNNNYGRLLSQFSVYSQNFAVQTVQRRIIQPIQDWNAKYASEKADKTPIMKLAWYARTGNDDAFKRIFGEEIVDGVPKWEAAYNDFPVQAFDNAFRVVPVVMGVGKAMLITRAALMDTINMASNEAMGNDDYEAWRGLNKQLTLNPYDPPNNQVRIDEVFTNDETGYDIARLFLAGLHNAVELSFGGRAAQILISEGRFTQDGLWSKTPVTGMLNDLYNVATTPFRSTAEDMGRATAKEVFDFALLRSPIIGSFNEFRNGLSDIAFQKPKNREATSSLFDGETGLPLTDIKTLGF